MQEFEEVEEPEDDSPKQCLGPSCVNHARQGSKYCSDECGMKLAKRCEKRKHVKTKSYFLSGFCVSCVVNVDKYMLNQCK